MPLYVVKSEGGKEYSVQVPGEMLEKKEHKIEAVLCEENCLKPKECEYHSISPPFCLNEVKLVEKYLIKVKME
ncbi:MAG: hypothetical protein KAS01_01425 [Candidatus Pacebacteria bacterium]|nr:hypothetical protein [Candidatus Paceibacterota bacterium]